MSINRLVMLTKEYPSANDPSYSFVDQLARGFAGAGVHVTVIAPLSLTRLLRHGKKLPPRRQALTDRLTVLRPWTLSFSNLLPRLNQLLFERAVKNALRSVREKPDAIYGHFVSLSGVAAARIGTALGVSSFLGYGESSPALYAEYAKPLLRRALSTLCGVVAVSGENARELADQRILCEATRIGVFPNGVDPARFHPIDRRRARDELGFGQHAFIVGFVGGFIERKGVRALCDALRRVPDAHSVFIGRGPLEPDAPNMLHVGALPNDRIPTYLAACDLFALPTLAEGCCNAIVEALSIGLPVVSSDLPFNDDILNDDNSIRIDPRDPDALAAAIARIKNDPALRERLAQGALRSAEELTIGARVQRILRFMEDTGIG